MSKRILVFGTSITRGANDYEKGGWVERLRNFIDNEYENIQVYNLGVSGDTSKDILNRFKNEAKARNPEVIIFDMGINDSSERESLRGNKVPKNFYGENIKRLIAEARKLVKKVIFVGLTRVDEEKTTPIPWNKEAFYYNKNSQEYNELLKKICQKENIDFIDIFELLDAEDLHDGLHPNAKGHEKIFQKVKNSLIKNKII